MAHPGVYRKRLVTTSLTPGNIVQYTHQSKVPSEMNMFVDMMRVSGFPLFERVSGLFAETSRGPLRSRWLPGFMLCLVVSTLSP